MTEKPWKAQNLCEHMKENKEMRQHQNGFVSYKSSQSKLISSSQWAAGPDREKAINTI